MEILGLVNVPTWLLLIIGLILLVLWYSHIKFSHFTNLGIPGPKPLPLFGNLHEYVKVKSEDMAKLDMVWRKKYGDVVGIYTGYKPALLIFDLEMISQVTVKQFDHFTNRTNFGTNDPIQKNFLTVLEDDHWKHVRSMMSPTFTTGKLRQMTQEINRCAKQLAEVVTNGEPIDMMECCGNYTMDVIASTAFGLRVDSQKSKDNPFTVNAKKIMDIRFTSPLFILALLFKPFGILLSKMGWSLLDKNALEFFYDVIRQTLATRKEGDKSRSDFIQLMSNAKKGETIVSKEDATEVENLETKAARSGLTDNEILANALIFFLAGFDTTMIGLMFLFYELARNPECQERLLEEIDNVVGDKEDLTYDDITKMTYLEQCVQESLRLNPPGPKVDRMCKKDIEINGVPIKKGTTVSISVLAIHLDPEIYPEPNKFDPNRFSQEEKAKRNPITWMSFGYGPRNCIGMRQAIFELKAAVVQVLRKHKIVTCSKTEDPIEFQKGKWLKPKNGLWLACEKRK